MSDDVVGWLGTLTLMVLVTAFSATSCHSHLEKEKLTSELAACYRGDPVEPKTKTKMIEVIDEKGNEEQ